MKRSFVLLLLTIIITAGLMVDRARAETYYIYIKRGDKQFFQTKYKNTVSISYTCKCYVKNTDLSFICADNTKGTIFKNSLPPQCLSMSAFAEMALKKSRANKNTDLNNAVIYIIEDYQQKYRYYQVKFYTA